jgi:amidase
MKSLPDKVAFLDATAQAELVRRREVKPAELLELAVQRIERLNPLALPKNSISSPLVEPR